MMAITMIVVVMLSIVITVAITMMSDYLLLLHLLVSKRKVEVHYEKCLELMHCSYYYC
jgi:hypothetical protein